MTLRHRIRVIAISSALMTGGIAAVPVATTASAASPVIRNDALAGVASDALTNLQRYLATGDLSARAAYDINRREIATVVASRLELDPTALEQAWRAADNVHQQALMAALTQLGVPYRRNALKPGVGLDCSGLTSYAWSQAGVAIPHQSARQINGIARRTADTVQAGDIVYYPGHAMMSLGVGGAIIHAPYTGRTVEVDIASTRRSLRYGDPLG